MAAMFDHLETVKFLIEQGSSIDPVDSEGRSPLLLAATRHCCCVVRHLIQRGANIRVKDPSSRNLIHLLISQELIPHTFKGNCC
jgi:ankyrin repeat protein